MPQRVLFCDKRGVPLAEMDCSIKMAWALNQYAQAQIMVPKSDPKATEINLRFGNLVYFEHERAGVWGGVIWTPRVWTTAAIQVTALSGEFQLKRRRADMFATQTEVAGHQFQWLIAMANEKEDTRLRVGDLYLGGNVWPFDLHGENMYDTVCAMASAAGQDWGCTPDFDSTGRLYFNACWYSQRGMYRVQRLEEGVNLKEGDDDFYSEQGNIINDLLAYGQGATWQSRPQASLSDTISAGMYGLTQLAVGLNTTSPATLDTWLAANLPKNVNPRKYWGLVATDANGTFDYLGLGDTLPIVTKRYGFGPMGQGMYSYGRIRGKAFDPETGEMALTLVEPTEGLEL